VVDTTQNKSFYTTFGISESQYSLDDVLSKKAGIYDLMSSTQDGIKVINIVYEDFLKTRNKDIITKIFSSFEVRLIDTATDELIPDDLLCGPIAGEVAIVTTCEPASITAAYSKLKIVSSKKYPQKIKLLVNQAMDEKEGIDVNNSVEHVVNKHLGIQYEYLGSIPSDILLQKAIRQRRAVVSLFPEAISSKRFTDLASIFF
jgi:flagellar biosynthesis protein FlhG